MMHRAIEFLSALGAASLAPLWMPLLFWTGITLLVLGLLRLGSKRLHPVIHYQTRLALLLALPLGIVFTLLLDAPLRVVSTANPTIVGQTLQLIQQEAAQVVTTSPLPASPITAPLPPIGLAFWLGLFTCLAMGLVLWRLAHLLRDTILLHRFKRTLRYVERALITQRISDTFQTDPIPSVRYAITEDAQQIPLTFGWLHPTVVLPAWLLDRDEDLQMVLLHEWTHIRRRDYLWHWMERLVDTIFAIHPLVHHLVKQIGQQREWVCDAEVLARHRVPVYNYATLLYRMVRLKEQQPAWPALSMTSRLSLIQRRISAMKKHVLTPNQWRLTRQISLTLCALLLSLSTFFVACSELDTGMDRPILLSEQNQMTFKQAAFYINNEPLTQSEHRTSLAPYSESVLYLFHPSHGLFTMSLKPFPGATMAGKIEGSELSATLDETTLRITSSEPILEGNTASLYIQHDPSYAQEQLAKVGKINYDTFLFGTTSQQPESLYDESHLASIETMYEAENYGLRLHRPMVFINGKNYKHGLTGFADEAGYIALYHSDYGRLIFAGSPFEGASQVAQVEDGAGAISVNTPDLSFTIGSEIPILRQSNPTTLWFRYESDYIPPPSSQVEETSRNSQPNRAILQVGDNIAELL